MKLTSQYIKNNYLILTIKLLIVCLFIFKLIQGNIETSIYWNFVAETKSGLKNYFNVLRETSFYRPAIILLIPLIGIFINKKIGWIIIQGYFYFLVINLTFQLILTDLTYNQNLIINLVGFLLLLLIILSMNKKKVSNLFYGIDKTELVGKNIIASIIGISITIILAAIKASEI